MNPVLFDLGFIQIKWYSVLVLSAFIIGYFLVINRSKKMNMPITKITDFCFYLVIVAILGARLYYCLFYVNDLGVNPYFSNPVDMLKVWEGGLAIHGGMIASFIFLVFYSRKKELDILKLLDILAPAVALGQCIGRWGNFFNSEAFGSETTLETLKGLHIPKFIIDGMHINGSYYHPTFLYESIGCLIIFIILICIRNRVKDGQTIGVYFILYGIIRFFIESLRTDSLLFFNLKIAQIISVILILAGLYFFIRPYLRRTND